MERGLNSSHVEQKNDHAATVFHGEQVTDADLLKAGVDELREDNVMNVDLVAAILCLCPTHTNYYVRLLLWVPISQIRGERAIENSTPCAF